MAAAPPVKNAENVLATIQEKFTMKGQVHKAYITMVRLLDPRVIKGDKHIPLSLIKHAKALVFLTVMKAGFLVAATGGHGIIIRRLDDDTWSGPAYVGVGGVGVGPQVGITAIDSVLVLTSEEAVDTFCNNAQFKLGGSFSIALGLAGRQGEAAFAPAVKDAHEKVGNDDLPEVGHRSRRKQHHAPQKKLTFAACYAYSHSSGVFVGVSLEGAVIVQRHHDNRKYYGRQDVSVRDILHGKVVNEEYDRELHLLHQSLGLLAERLAEGASQYNAFDNYFKKKEKEVEKEHIDEKLHQVNRNSVLFHRHVNELIEKANQKYSYKGGAPEGEDGVQEMNVLDAGIMNFLYGDHALPPIRQPNQPSSFATIDKKFSTLRSRGDTFFTEVPGPDELSIVEYEWVKELKILVKDSGFLYTYGVVRGGETVGKEAPNQYFDDFEYAMFALIEGGNLSKSLQRMKNVLDYLSKNEFSFRFFDKMGRVQQGGDFFKKIFFTMVIDCGTDKEGAPVVGLDLSKFDAENFVNGKENEFLQSLIWMIRMYVVDLATFRTGISIFLDIGTAGKENLPKTALRKRIRPLLTLLAEQFPIRIKRIGLVNVKNAAVVKFGVSSIGKLMLPRSVRRRLQIIKEEDLMDYVELSNLPLCWAGARLPFSEESLNKFVKGQRMQYMDTVIQLSRMEEDVEKEKLFA